MWRKKTLKKRGNQRKGYLVFSLITKLENSRESKNEKTKREEKDRKKAKKETREKRRITICKKTYAEMEALKKLRKKIDWKEKKKYLIRE